MNKGLIVAGVVLLLLIGSIVGYYTLAKQTGVDEIEDSGDSGGSGGRSGGGSGEAPVTTPVSAADVREDCCQCLEIFDGDPKAPVLGRFCGREIPPEVVSPSETFVYLHNDCNGYGRGDAPEGFALRYTALTNADNETVVSTSEISTEQ